jgi:hypothetical protein
MSDVIPHLWYADKAEEAVAFPAVLAGMIKDPGPCKMCGRSHAGLIKLDIAGLQKAYDAR